MLSLPPLLSPPSNNGFPYPDHSHYHQTHPSPTARQVQTLRHFHPKCRRFRRHLHFTTISPPELHVPGGSHGNLPPPVTSASAASDDEYKKDTEEVINKVRSTINMDKTDPNVASAVAELREASNTWVAKYRREKALLGRPSFRDMYSALNAVSGHYISFGPTVPIPTKRKARILEEVDTAEKALSRGR
ncbi:hypothetical protein NMG60_11035554 [Bertholletia excelsa]